MTKAAARSRSLPSATLLEIVGDLADDEAARLDLAARLEAAGCDRAAEAVLDLGTHDAADARWQARRAEAVAAAEARLEREAEREDAAARRLAPITPIDAANGDDCGPSAADLADESADAWDREAIDLDILAEQFARRRPAPRGAGAARRRLGPADARLLAAVGHRVAVA